MGTLLAVDLGLRTGLAVYGPDGRLTSYQSRNFGTTTRLRSAVHDLLAEPAPSRWLVMEGGGPLADIWRREAARLGTQTIQLAAEDWRRSLFYDRQYRNGAQAKHSADAMARRVIRWSHAPKPTSLRHDAAEAILIGLYGVLHVGWLEQLPPELKP